MLVVQLDLTFTLSIAYTVSFLDEKLILGASSSVSDGLLEFPPLLPLSSESPPEDVSFSFTVTVIDLFTGVESLSLLVSVIVPVKFIVYVPGSVGVNDKDSVKLPFSASSVTSA